MIKILVVEDDLEIQQSSKIFLEDSGYTVSIANDGIEALELFDSSVNLVLLDLMLPKMDGFAVCKRIREISQVPIIMLTALNSEHDQIRGFDLKVDDYVAKPFSISILLRKIQAVLRRTIPNEIENNLIYKDVTIDLIGMTVSVNNLDVGLTAKELNIVLELFTHQGVVFTRDMIFNKLWGYDECFDDRVINTHMRNIRRKMGVDHIKTIRGVGYKVEKLYKI